MRKYRILSLDGGGSWALIQVRALLELFGDLPGRKVLSQFDFAAANSGGSIVLAAMLEGMKLSKILRFFETEAKRKSIFVKLNLVAELADEPSRLITGGPRYYTANKLAGLEELLPNAGRQPLDEVCAAVKEDVGRCPKLLITSFDYDRLRSIYFRSDAKSIASNSTEAEQTTLAEVVHASSNAPIKYFDLPAEVLSSLGTRRCWDGGLAACNNPVLAALSEVLANQYNVSKADKAPMGLAVLSIGTATVRLPLQTGEIPKGLATELVKPGLAVNLDRAAIAILDDPPDAATFTVYTWLGGFQSSPLACPIIRMNPLIQPILENGQWVRPVSLEAQDGKDPFVTLVDLEMDAVEQPQVDLIRLLADAWIKGNVLNQPIRADNKLQCQIGHNTFAEAKSAWMTLNDS